MSDQQPRTTSLYLRNRHVIIPGGSRGIGAAIASVLAQHGARITLMGRTERDLNEHAERLTADSQVESQGIVCDVTDAKSVISAFESAEESFGTPYALVNCAGQGTSTPFTEISLDEWNSMLALNLTGTFLCSQQVLPTMLSVQDGRIINIASTAGLRGYGRVVAYSAAKHGVIGLTRSLALETAKHGITVNAVCPGYTETEMLDRTIERISEARHITTDEARGMITRTIPRGQLTHPNEVANAVAWLCSPDATAITGQSIAVAGGEVM